MTAATLVSLALGVLAVAAGPVHAQQQVVISGVVKRADNGAPVAGALIRIKARALANSQVLNNNNKTTTDQDGRYQVSIPARDHFVCEASADGLAPQLVSRTAAQPICNFKLESRLRLSNVGPQSPIQGRGPGLSLEAHVGSSQRLRDLRLRLHLTKPGSCGSSGVTQYYHLGGTVDVSFGKATGTITSSTSGITSSANVFQVTGTAPLKECEPAVVSLHLQPAAELPAGSTQIVITLPATLTLKDGASSRQMTLTGSGLKPTYRSTIEKIDVELITTEKSMASTHLSGLSIPVGVNR